VVRILSAEVLGVLVFTAATVVLDNTRLLKLWQGVSYN